MITVRLFPALVQWLIADGRSLMVLPVPRSPGEMGETEHAETSSAIAHGPCAIVTSIRSITRMLRLGPTDRPAPKPLLAGREGHLVTHILDLGGTYIPATGTPVAVMIVGPITFPAQATVRVLRCDRGEPRTPPDAEWGHVFRAVLDGWDTLGSSEWTTTTDVDRRDVGAVLRALDWREREVPRG